VRAISDATKGAAITIPAYLIHDFAAIRAKALELAAFLNAVGCTEPIGKEAHRREEDPAKTRRELLHVAGFRVPQQGHSEVGRRIA
jgi:hypothetical protein